MKTYKSVLIISLLALIILGCSCCGITIPFLQGTTTPTPTPIPAAETQPSLDQVQIIFMADRTNINSGECAMLQWAVTGPAQVIYLDNIQVPPTGQKQVCPQTTTTYILVAGLGTPQLSKQSQVVISVSPATPTATVTHTPTKPAVVFVATATRTQTPTPTTTVTSPPPPSGGGSWGPVGTDIQVYEIRLTSSTGESQIIIGLKNNGPKEFNGDVEYTCTGTSYVRNNLILVSPVGYGEKIHIILSIGTGDLPTKLYVNPAMYVYPIIQCAVVVPDDPEPNNNSGMISIP